MSDQPRVDPFEPSPLFSDGMGMRNAPAGTIAWDDLRDDDYGARVNGQFAAAPPQQLLEERPLPELLRRGRERYSAFCSHCHGAVGGGAGGDEQYLDLVGMVVKRGYPIPQTYHQERLRNAPLGHFVDVITNGSGKMPAHDYLIPAADRWAIAVYVRALQFSQFAPVGRLQESDLAHLSTQNPSQD